MVAVITLATIRRSTTKSHDDLMMFHHDVDVLLFHQNDVFLFQRGDTALDRASAAGIRQLLCEALGVLYVPLPNEHELDHRRRALALDVMPSDDEPTPGPDIKDSHVFQVNECRISGEWLAGILLYFNVINNLGISFYILFTILVCVNFDVLSSS